MINSIDIMPHQIKEFYKFVRYATYSPLIHLCPFIVSVALFPVSIRLLEVSSMALCYGSSLVLYYGLNIIAGYGVFKYMKKIGYFEAVNSYSDRPLFWLDISFHVWYEVLGIFLRKISRRITIKSPTKVPCPQFFNMDGLSIAEKASKITKYRRFVLDHPLLYPNIQWRLFQIQEFLARYQIDQEIAAIRAKQQKPKAAAPAFLNWHTILGVKTDTSFEEVKRAYKKLAMKLHPDKGGDTSKFQELQAAWQLAKNHFGHNI